MKVSVVWRSVDPFAGHRASMDSLAWWDRLGVRLHSLLVLVKLEAC